MIQHPVLHTLARPALDDSAVEAFLEKGGLGWRRSPSASDAEEIVEFAGRVCYMSFGRRQSARSNDEYIARLVTQGHHSVLEHATWTFLLTGISRAFTHQFVRHRIGFSYSQLSQQYHDERDASAVMPDAVRARPAVAATWRRAVEHAQQAYREILEALEHDESPLESREALRLVRSSARTVLPAATETAIAFTANARALRHFLEERGGIAGDEEMRAVCVLVLAAMQTEAPSLFADFSTVEGPAGPEVRRGEQ